MVSSFKSITRGNIEIIFSNRHGGCSAAPYNSLNLGSHVGDDRGDVIRNRELLYKQISETKTVRSPGEWVFLNQTHKNNVLSIGENFSIDNEDPPEADASVTQIRNLPLVCMTADCGPLVIFSQNALGVVHASWRTVTDEIIESTLEELKYVDPKGEFKAILGPCIHPGNYEFDQDFLEELSSKLGSHVKSQTEQGKPAFDLVGAINHKLTEQGVILENADIDTYSSKNYFSYRRDGVTGRQAVIAWLK
ncbi:MAG TPA: polyphenol oxidase family protein [Acidimicrobiia bacterium]|nr:polyphenol oxidase family protein [Acidimicrobiia bacterium]